MSASQFAMRLGVGSVVASSMRGKIVQVRPTLRGLVVLPDNDTSPATATVCFPWTRVGRVYRSESGSSYWRVYDESGHEEIHDGVRRRLVIRDDRASRIARKAQLRAFRHAWRRGDFVLHEHYVSRRAAGWTLLVLAMAASVVWIIWLSWGFCRIWAADHALPLPREYFTLLAALMIGVVIGSCFLAWIPIFIGFHLATKPWVVSARFDHRRVQAEGLSGLIVTGTWRELKDVRQIGLYSRVRFRDGTAMWFDGSRPRTLVLLAAIQDSLVPKTAEQAKRAFRRSLMRAVLWVVLLAIVTAILVDQVGRMLPTPVSWHLPVVCVLVIGLVPLGLLRLSVVERRYWEWYKKRARRRSVTREGKLPAKGTRTGGAA